MHAIRWIDIYIKRGIILFLSNFVKLFIEITFIDMRNFVRFVNDRIVISSTNKNLKIIIWGIKVLMDMNGKNVQTNISSFPHFMKNSSKYILISFQNSNFFLNINTCLTKDKCLLRATTYYYNLSRLIEIKPMYIEEIQLFLNLRTYNAFMNTYKLFRITHDSKCIHYLKKIRNQYIIKI